MKARFIVCSNTGIDGGSFEDFSSSNGLNHDWRSLASEKYALEYLRIKKFVLGETELIDKYASQGVKVPECIAEDPSNPGRLISVEVKRICGNQLPLDYTGQERRKLRKRNKLIWPWGSTISNSLLKAHPQIVADLKIERHWIVFVVPDSLSNRSLKRMCERIESWVVKGIELVDMPVKYVDVHIIQGDDRLFDRF